MSPPLRGLALARGYYDDVVGPLLVRHGVRHAAARVGAGSEVLGFDDDVSRDHDWGLRLQVFVAPDEVGAVDALLARELPAAYRGLPARFALARDAREVHRVDVATVAAFLQARLGLDGEDDGLPHTHVDWLLLTGQSILEVTAGAVFHDDDGALTSARARLAWYPDDVWRYTLAAGWDRLADEMPLQARAARRGDGAGARILAARLARDLVHLAFLVCRRWPPYPKWLGAAAARLPLAGFIDDVARIVDANDTAAREAALTAAARSVAEAQRAHGLPTPVDVVAPFHDRGFAGVHDDAAALLKASIGDDALRALPLTGAVEQWCDSVAVLAWPRRRAALRALYGRG